MKIKTSELIDAPLDWAVATCVGLKSHSAVSFVLADQYIPSVRWAQGGPIIEHNEISIKRVVGGWMATSNRDMRQFIASTPLLAAMRCYVTSKLGDEVDVPEELVCPKAS